MYRNMFIHVLIQIDVYAYIETYKEDVIMFQDEVSRTILLYTSVFTYTCPARFLSVAGAHSGLCSSLVSRPPAHPVSQW